MFTREQIEEISRGLKEITTTRRDTEFPKASTAFNNTELVPIVQDGANRVLPLTTLISKSSDEVSSLPSALINISASKGEEGEEVARPYTLEDAIKAVPEDYRRPGLLITFIEEETPQRSGHIGDDSIWSIYQFTKNTLEDWELVTSWIAVNNLEIPSNYIEGFMIADETITKEKLNKWLKLPSPESLTIKDAEGHSLGEYDGSQEIEINLPPSSGGGELVGPAGGDLAGTYPNPTIGSKKVTTEKVADQAIGTEQLKDKNVTAEKVADHTLTTLQYAEGSVTYDILADNSVRADKIADQGIAPSKLAPGVIPSSLPNPFPITIQVDDNPAVSYDGSIDKNIKIVTTGGSTEMPVDTVTKNPSVGQGTGTLHGSHGTTYYISSSVTGLTKLLLYEDVLPVGGYYNVIVEQSNLSVEPDASKIKLLTGFPYIADQEGDVRRITVYKVDEDLSLANGAIYQQG